MDIREITIDRASVDDGRWIGKEDIPALQDIRIKVRGFTGCKAVREAHAARERGLPAEQVGADGKPNAEGLDALGRAPIADLLVDVDGLTDGDKKLKAEDVARLAAIPENGRLVGWIEHAARIVDATTIARREALAKN